MIEWISEETGLPRIGQTVLLATPRHGEFWDINTAMLLVAHEGVIPLPVQRGATHWPVDYYWSWAHDGSSNRLITGNGWWASLRTIPLPPAAEHGSNRGYDFIRQTGDIFVGQGRKR